MRIHIQGNGKISKTTMMMTINKNIQTVELRMGTRTRGDGREYPGFFSEVRAAIEGRLRGRRM
jgi:hypothetical protein